MSATAADYIGGQDPKLERFVQWITAAKDLRDGLWIRDLIKLLGRDIRKVPTRLSLKTSLIQ